MNEHFSAISTRFLKRRQFLKLGAAATVAAAVPRAFAAPVPGSGFTPLAMDLTANHRVAAGYRADVLIAWGDGLDGSPAPAFPLDAAQQAERFGFNNDFIAYTPLDGSDQGLLGINHEYPIAHLMFPGLESEVQGKHQLSAARVQTEMASLGHSVIEVKRDKAGAWHIVAASPYRRRIHVGTPMDVDGPAAGHALMRTVADPTGRRVLGTMGCCSGGTTPWGTVLIAEENVGDYFSGGDRDVQLPNDLVVKDQADVFTSWARHDRRFDMARDPNELNRFGWIVEYDPRRPDRPPVKRTALGRFEHETATVAARPGAPVVVYSGDDEENECIYRYVSAAPYEPDGATDRLLSEGTLYCAQFNDDGTGRWLPLRYGDGPLTAQAGFPDAGSVAIRTRSAAALVGATHMDRPEGIAISDGGAVYIAMTKNKKKAGANAANPRERNAAGHILELRPPLDASGARHWDDRFEWDLLLAGGDPAASGDARGRYGPGRAPLNWLANPDNLAFDARGRLWVATDGMDDFGYADGLWCTPVNGPDRARPAHFLACPRGAEMCGPTFTPDGRTLFAAVQHPAKEAGSNYDTPSTRWPDFDERIPPRSAIIAITRSGGGLIGD